MSHLIIFGPPGSGKGTQAKKIANLLKARHLSVGEILRQATKDKHPLSKYLQTTMVKGCLVKDEIVNQIVKDRLKKEKRKKIVFDGYPRNLNQARFLDKLIDPQQLTVISLTVTEKETLKRLALRGRIDDQVDNVKKRWKIYHQNTQPLLKYYQKQNRLKEINGQGSIKQVFSRLKKGLS